MTPRNTPFCPLTFRAEVMTKVAESSIRDFRHIMFELERVKRGSYIGSFEYYVDISAMVYTPFRLAMNAWLEVVGAGKIDSKMAWYKFRHLTVDEPAFEDAGITRLIDVAVADIDSSPSGMASHVIKIGLYISNIVSRSMDAARDRLQGQGTSL